MKLLNKALEKLGLKKKPTIWFSSDFHFNHKNVIQYCDRPYKDCDEMNAAMVKQWNLQVKDEDTVYVLGDFSLNPKWSKIIVPQLKGKKILISGNHDATFPHSWDKKDKWVKMRNRYLDDGWSAVMTQAILTLSNGITVYMSHLPPLLNGFDDRFKEHRPKYKPEVVYLHGHLHNKYKRHKNLMDVGFDVELRLFSEQDVIDTFNGPEEQPGRPMTQVLKNREDMIG